MELILSVVAALLGTVFVGLVGLLIYNIFKPVENSNDYTSQLEELVGSEFEKVENENSIVFKWNNYWGTLLSSSNIERYDDKTHAEAGREVLIIFTSIFLVSLLLMRNIFLAAVIVLVLWYLIVFYIRMSFDKKSKAISEQLSGLLFSIKSNLQAGNNNERALMGVIDSMPSPLRDELIVGRDVLLSSGTFKQALQEMSAHTSSRDLKFLCSCMIQATASGSSLILQLDNIQKVLEERRRVANEINTAVKAVTPALWLSGLIIPVMFVVSYFIDSSAKGFWFNDIVAWIGFFAILALYIAGLVLVKREVDKVKNI